MTTTLAAILDCPTPDTMAMRGLILRDETGYFTSGLTRSRQISATEFSELVADRHVLAVEHDLPDQLLHNDHVRACAFWVGARFEDEAQSFQVPGPFGPRMGTVHTVHGRFWIDLAQPVYYTTQHWLTNALRVALRTDSSQVTRLMTRVDSSSDCTRAAVLRQSPHPDREVARFLTRDLDYGLTVTEPDLRSRLAALSGRAQEDPVPVLAVVAGALEGSYEWAKQFASDVGVATHKSVGFSAFREYFGREAERLFGTDDRRSKMDAGTLITTWRAPEAIAEQAVLQPLRHDSSLPPAVIDGVRHEHIVEAFRRLDQVTLRVGLYDDQVRPAELDSSVTSIEEVLTDPTEREISSLRRQADYQLPKEHKKARAVFAA